MNKRINELAIQAGGIWQGGYVEQANGDSVYTDKKFVHGGDMDVEQFAQLMIIEFTETVKQTAILVAQTAYNNGETEANVNKRVNATMRVLDVMRERFGVE
jgi:hypothetical protein